jgi:hypothetical protein
MASKRDYISDNDDPSQPSSKRQRRQQSQKSSKHAENKRDPTYGQRAAFPGLNDGEPAQLTDDDLEFEEDADAIAYLRSVR